MVGLGEGALAVEVGLLLAGFGYAAYEDLRTREVTDALWQVLGVAGLLVGAVALFPGGAIPLLLWLAVGGLAAEHMFAWDQRLGPRLEPYADLLELGGYGAVAALVFGVAVRFGVGDGGVPIAVLAVFASVLIARGLFEAGVLYGGADAKALMIAGLLVPLFPSPWLLASPALVPLTSVLPFSVDLLMNAALLSLAVPVGVAVRNAARGEFELWRGFTGFSIPVAELPRRFVWVRDPSFGDARREEGEVETSEDDRLRRVEIARELADRGIRRVWVTPQIPFLVVMAVGAVAALLAGNLVVDLIRLV